MAKSSTFEASLELSTNIDSSVYDAVDIQFINHAYKIQKEHDNNHDTRK